MGELCRNGLPPIAEIAASAETVCVAITDLEEGDFFFGCESLPSFAWCVPVVLRVEIMRALHAPRGWPKSKRTVFDVLEEVHWHRHKFQDACDDDVDVGRIMVKLVLSLGHSPPSDLDLLPKLKQSVYLHDHIYAHVLTILCRLNYQESLR